jgi:hypothetical protein
MRSYYNDNDPFCVEWLKNLIEMKIIADGDVDNRSIQDVTGNDLRGYTQCHFFAGIGGWSYALRLAGVPDDYPVWTGSCPCQPFSVAGKRRGTKDKRHLWPEFRRLIGECRPPLIFGEQVASKDGREWLSGTNPNLQRVRDREAIFRVLCELEGVTSKQMQGLHEAAAAAIWADSKRSKEARVQFLEAQETGLCIGRDCEEPGKTEGNTIQSYSGEDTGNYRCRSLSDDRHSIQFVGGQDMGQSISGSNRLFSGIHHGQCEGCPLLPECHGEYLGSQQNLRDSKCDKKESARAEQYIAEQIRREIERENVEVFQSGVRSDLEALGYAVGGADLCAASCGAPHIRQRLYWVADRIGKGPQGWDVLSECPDQWSSWTSSMVGGVGITDSAGPQPGSETSEAAGYRSPAIPTSGHDCGLPDPNLNREIGNQSEYGNRRGAVQAGPWDNYILIPCADGKTRRIEPGLMPLAHGISNRVGLIRGYGNAIVPQVAEVFIRSFFDVLNNRITLGM